MSTKWSIDKVYQELKEWSNTVTAGMSTRLDCGCCAKALFTQRKNTAKTEIILCEYHHVRSLEHGALERLGVKRSKNWSDYMQDRKLNGDGEI